MGASSPRCRPVYDPAHPLGCHRPRIPDRIIFEKLVQVMRSGCSYDPVADCICPATITRERRSEWIKAGIPTVSGNNRLADAGRRWGACHELPPAITAAATAVISAEAARPDSCPEAAFRSAAT